MPAGRIWIVLAAVAAVTAGTAAMVGALNFAKGGVTVSDDTNCPGGGNAAQVTVPFSIEATGLTPFSQTSQLFITDKEAKPDVTYGPITIQDVDATGRACANVLHAPPGHWKIDVVEESSGFTDSKVFTIMGPATGEPTTTTTTSTTSSTSTTSTLPTTTTSSSSTTSTPTTTTTVPATTSTTLPAVVHLPGSDLPWTIVFVTTASNPIPPTLPRTGANDFGSVVLASALLGVGGILLLRVRRRR